MYLLFFNLILFLSILIKNQFHCFSYLFLPSWKQFSSLAHYVSAFAGFLSLGIGDSAASTFGSKFGKIKLSGTSKTFEGTLFSIIAQLIFVWYLSFMVHFPINLRLVFTIGITSLYEAFTDQIDNLVLPLLIFPFLNLL